VNGADAATDVLERAAGKELALKPRGPVGAAPLSSGPLRTPAALR
jgi:hypothetical protein